MMPEADRILLVAPLGADAHNLSVVLSQAGLHPAACRNLKAVATEMERGCSAILLTEEALNDAGADLLSAALNRQPPWSDLPLVLIVTGGHIPSSTAQAVRWAGPRTNITLVERPLRRATLLSTLHAARRARQRQYEVRQLLEERDELLITLERRVAERTAELETLNAELEAFSYSVSHDLRAPLRSLSMYAKILGEEYKDTLPPTGRHYADRIAANAERMDRLTRDVLTLSRLTRTNLNLEVLDLDHALREVIAEYPDLAAASDRIEVCSPLGRVVGHAGSLTQCFSNLLQNALKFIPAGQTPRIRVYSEARPGKRRVFVEDNGPGIAPADHRRIFGMFERANATSVPGTGIGLAIVKKAVERMGGAVGIESALGQGSRFWVELTAAPG